MSTRIARSLSVELPSIQISTVRTGAWVASSQLQDIAFLLLNSMRLVSLPLHPVQVSPDGATPVGHSNEFHVICEYAESALYLIVHTVNEDVSRDYNHF